MNLLSFLQGRATRILRQRVETMEDLVKVVQRDAKVSENRLRASIARARDDLDRPPIAAAIAWPTREDD
jgi:DNA-binding winged helix-turn-helix (wHTH) protein